MKGGNVLLSNEDKDLKKAPLAGSDGDEEGPKGFWDDFKQYLAELRRHKLLCCALVVVIVSFFVLPVYCAWPFASCKAGLTAVASGFAGAAGMASVILACYSVKQTWESDKSVRHILAGLGEMLGKTQETQEKMQTLQEDMRQLQVNTKLLQDHLCGISLDVKHVVEVAEENRESIRVLSATAMKQQKKGSGTGTAEPPFGEEKPDELTRTGEPAEPDSKRDDSGAPET